MNQVGNFFWWVEWWLVRRLGRKIEFGTAPEGYVYQWRGKLWPTK